MIIVKKLIKITLYPLYYFYKKQKFKSFLKKSFKEQAEMVHLCHYKKNIDWLHPRDLNEKIRWLQLNTDTEIWSRLADKYAVRKYVQEKGYEDILVKLYGKWNSADEIDFTTLPNSFILKTNHGSGEVIVVKDKQKANLKKIRRMMQQYLETPFGIKTAEPHYLKIKPCIIAEELLEQDGGISSSLIDYKFFCFHGKPISCGVFYDRSLKSHSNSMTPYDMDWIKHEEWRRQDLKMAFKNIPKPVTFDRMIQACQDLAAQFPFVRMDFYEVKGHLYFGEFTFTPAALTGGSFTQEIMEEWGKLLKIEPECVIDKESMGK